MQTKQCKLCYEDKPAEAFSKDTRLADGLAPYCKECKKARYYRRSDMPDTPDLCPALHIPLTDPVKVKINKNKGWTEDNIMILSSRAVELKADATLSEIVWLGEFYRDLSLNKEKALKGEKVLDSSL